MQILRRSKSVFKIKFSLLCACYKQPYTKEHSKVLQILPWVQVLSLSFASFSLMDICLGFWQASLRRLSKVIRGGVSPTFEGLSDPPKLEKCSAFDYQTF